MNQIIVKLSEKDSILIFFGLYLRSKLHKSQRFHKNQRVKNGKREREKERQKRKNIKRAHFACKFDIKSKYIP